MKTILPFLLMPYLLFWVSPLAAKETGAKTAVSSQTNAVAALETWLKQSPKTRGPIEEASFSQKPLSKKEAADAKALLWKDHVKQIKATRTQEWENKKIVLDKREMKFEYKVFGKKPKEGRSLFISMHGGGNGPAQLNDQQWRNQIHLYRPKEGIYLAPRAPTNTWDLWHQAHIDHFFTRIIEDAIVLADVNPNRVYIMGYSAGGDGVYQLAPRMADQLAAAAMMAGHPNNASPEGLRNIGFTIHVGGRDAAYNRNKIAAEWKIKLDKLQEADPSGYKHKVVIPKQYAHWMNREDAVAVPWMAKFTRNPQPEKVVWRQSDKTHSRFYWLAVENENEVAGSLAIVRHKGQVFTIEKTEKLKELIIRLNEKMIDFDKPVIVRSSGKELFNAKVQRNIATISKTLKNRGDLQSIYLGEIKIAVDKANDR